MHTPKQTTDFENVYLPKLRLFDRRELENEPSFASATKMAQQVKLKHGPYNPRYKPRKMHEL